MSKRPVHRTNKPRGKGKAHGPGGWVGDDPRFRATLRRLDANGFAWEDIARDVLPVFERARPFPFAMDPPALAVLPPGVTVGFGIDAGPAFMRIATTQLEGWPVDIAGLAEQALANLARRARKAGQRDLMHDAIADVPVTVFQSMDGWASTTVLLPEAMLDLFGREPRFFIAPSRDVLVGLPIDVELEFATWLTEEFEAADPNALRLEGFEWRDGIVRCRPLERAAVAV